jgi:hypothetical protein
MKTADSKFYDRRIAFAAKIFISLINVSMKIQERAQLTQTNLLYLKTTLRELGKLTPNKTL